MRRIDPLFLSTPRGLGSSAADTNEDASLRTSRLRRRFALRSRRARFAGVAKSSGVGGNGRSEVSREASPREYIEGEVMGGRGMGDAARRRTSGGTFSPSCRVSFAARARCTCSGVRSWSQPRDEVESRREEEDMTESRRETPAAAKPLIEWDEELTGEIGEGGTGGGRRSRMSARSSRAGSVDEKAAAKRGMLRDGRREARERARWISLCSLNLLWATVALRLSEPEELVGSTPWAEPELTGETQRDGEAGVGGKSSRNAPSARSGWWVAPGRSSTGTGMGTSPRIRLSFRDLRRRFILSDGSRLSARGIARRGCSGLGSGEAGSCGLHGEANVSRIGDGSEGRGF